MAIELEKRELRSYEIRKHKQKQREIIITIIIVFIAIGLVAFVVNQILHKNYMSYQVIHTVERSDSSSASYQNYGTGVLKYSRDGAVELDVAGNPLWNGTFEMKDPILDICDRYVAVSDRGYKEVQIFNGKGGMSTVSVLNPIMKTEVANQGVVAVLMDGKAVNYIGLYDETGKSLVDIRTTTQKDGYPIDISLSNDGRKLVTSYAAVINGAIQNKITFYNFGGVGQNYVARVVGGYDYGQTLVPKIEFIDNNTVCAFGDDKFSIYSMKEIPELVYEKTFKSEIKSVFYSNKLIGFVLNNTEGDDKYRILLYDLKGKEVLNKTMNYDYDHVTLSGDELILYSDLEWIIFKSNGVEKLHYNFENNISFILPVNNKDKYIIIDNLNMEEVKLVEKKDVQK